MYGQGPMLRVKTKKIVRLVFLRTERKVRVALRAICYQIALD